jgi:hypothetical protein
MGEKKLSLRARLKKQKRELKNRSQGAQFFTIKDEGTVRMRPLPCGEEEEWGMEITFFYLSKEAGGGFVSPMTFGEPCPLMKLYNELSKSKKASDKELAKRIKPQKKFMVPHIRYKDEKGKKVDYEAGVKLLILSGGQYQKLIDLFLDEDNGDFTDPKTGYDIKYTREGKGKMDTRYDLMPGKPSPLDKKFNKIYDVKAMVRAVIPSKDEIKDRIEKFLSLPSEDDSSEEKTPKKKKRKSDM